MQAVTTAAAVEAKPKDDIFGICAAIGEDFGFNPDFIRVPLAASLLWSPMAVLILYASAGVLVLASRLIFPVAGRKRAVVVQVSAPAIEAREEPVLARAA